MTLLLLTLRGGDIAWFVFVRPATVAIINTRNVVHSSGNMPFADGLIQFEMTKHGVIFELWGCFIKTTLFSEIASLHEEYFRCWVETLLFSDWLLND